MAATAGERLRAQNRALVALARNDALRGHDLATAARALTLCTSKTLGVGRVGIWLMDKARRKLRAVDIYLATEDDHVAGEEILVSDYSTYFAALANERTIAAPDAAADEHTAELAGGHFEAHGIGAVLDAALRIDGELVGVVWCEHLGGRRAWTTDEHAFAAAVADLAVHALQARNRRTVEQALQHPPRERGNRLRHDQEIGATERLAGDIAHDLNNLLQAIGGYAELLERSRGLDVQARGRVEGIRGAVQRATTLTHRLLALRHRQDLQPSIPDLNSVVEEAAGPNGPGRSARGETIIVVEDDSAVRKLATEMLRLEGYIVRQADCGDGALTLLRAMSSPPRLLVTDLVLPGMSGRELAKAAIAIVPTLRVLYLSGYGHDVVAQHGMIEDGAYLLAKPFTAKDLNQAVREAIHAPV